MILLQRHKRTPEWQHNDLLENNNRKILWWDTIKTLKDAQQILKSQQQTQRKLHDFYP